jgi:hypothetical protein
VNHHASADFWVCYHLLDADVQKLADGAFALLRVKPRHPSLHLKKAGRYWSARVGLHHRAVGIDAPDGMVWFWIGTHDEYDRLLRK